MRLLLPEAAGFALAGAAAFAADLGIFVLLRGPGGLGPLTAKALSFLVGCLVAYLGNAFGTYRGRTPAAGRARRYGVFFAVNTAGAAIQLLCLACSHYLLGLTTPREDVVSALGVGMLLATALRFWGTRTLVFRAGRGPAGPAAGAAPLVDEPAQEDVRADAAGEAAGAGPEPEPGGAAAGPGVGTPAGAEAGRAPDTGSTVRGAERVPRPEEGNRPTWTG